MPALTSYSTVAPAISDKVIGSDASASNATAQLEVAAIAALMPTSIALNINSTTITAVPAAKTEMGGSTSRRLKVDLTNVTQARLSCRVSTAGSASAELRIEYSTDESTWAYLDGSAGPAVSLATVGTGTSSWANIASGAKADVFIRVVTFGGDGATNATVGNIYLQVR